MPKKPAKKAIRKKAAPKKAVKKAAKKAPAKKAPIKKAAAKKAVAKKSALKSIPVKKAGGKASTSKTTLEEVSANSSRTGQVRTLSGATSAQGGWYREICDSRDRPSRVFSEVFLLWYFAPSLQQLIFLLLSMRFWSSGAQTTSFTNPYRPVTPPNRGHFTKALLQLMECPALTILKRAYLKMYFHVFTP